METTAVLCLLFRTHPGQFVHVDVAAEAFREFRHDPRRMDLLMALGALGNVAMFIMVALGAEHLGMLARGRLPLGVDLGVAGTTANCRFICRVSDLLRFMH